MASACHQGVRGVLGASLDSRHSRTRRSIEDIRGHWRAPKGFKGPFGGIWSVRGVEGVTSDMTIQC